MDKAQHNYYSIYTLIIRCNLDKMLTQSEVQYILVSGNIALILPILYKLMPSWVKGAIQ